MYERQELCGYILKVRGELRPLQTTRKMIQVDVDGTRSDLRRHAPLGHLGYISCQVRTD